MKFHNTLLLGIALSVVFVVNQAVGQTQQCAYCVYNIPDNGQITFNFMGSNCSSAMQRCQSGDCSGPCYPANCVPAVDSQCPKPPP